MKLVLLSHMASTSAPTGAEWVLELTARELRARRHHVTVSAPGTWALAARLEEAGVDVYPIPIRCCWLVQAGGQPLPRQLWRGVRFALPDPGVRNLQNFLSAAEPDAVYVNCLPHVRGAAVARACGIPVLWHVHEILPPGPRRRWFAGRLRRDATRIVAVSEAVAEWLRAEGLDDRVVVVHNGIEAPAAMPDSSAARAAFGLPPGGVVVGLFSQLVAHKGAMDFVRAAHRAAVKDPELAFLIAGHGPDDFVAELRRRVAAGAAADRIRLVPPQPEIWPLLAAVDVASVTTLWPDPLPRVVMEAMAVGKPVVGYDGGGVPEMVVDGETGQLVRTGDEAGLCDAWLRLAADEGLRQHMGDAGARRAREDFSIEKYTDRMEAALVAVTR